MVGDTRSIAAEPPRNQVGKTRVQYKVLQSRVKHCTQQDKIKINQLRGTFFGYMAASYWLLVVPSYLTVPIIFMQS